MSDTGYAEAFEVGLEGFKKMSAKFLDHMKDRSLTPDQVEGAKKAYAVAYLNSRGSALDIHQMDILFKMSMRAYETRTSSETA